MIKMNETSKLFILFIIFITLAYPLISLNVSVLQKTNDYELYKNENTKISESISPNLLNMILQVNETTLQKHIQTIQNFGPHPTGSDALDLVGEYIYNELELYGLSVKYKPWTYKKYSGKNIEATINGTAKNDGIVIICAHYDSVAVSPGADDDGSGVAAVLVIANIMSKITFNSTVKFVFFSGEEQGIFGSLVYVQNAIENNENIIGVICLDGVGYAVTSEDGKKVEHFANDQSDWMIDISEEISQLYFDIIELEVLRRPHSGTSDHHSFVQYGYDGSFINNYILNPYWHTSEDRIEYMNFSYLCKICKLSLGTFVKIAYLNPMLSEDDIKISIKGTILSKPAQFCVRIENKNYKLDTSNLTIEI